VKCATRSALRCRQHKNIISINHDERMLVGMYPTGEPPLSHASGFLKGVRVHHTPSFSYIRLLTIILSRMSAINPVRSYYILMMNLMTI
jgi:hypothetical protein